MSCDGIQAGVSRAIDESRDLADFERHFAVCSECREFAASSLDLAGRYRRQVRRGIDRLRMATTTPAAGRSPARWLIPLAAAALVLCSVPLRRPPAESPGRLPAASARVPLFDGVPSDPPDLRLLAWSGEAPLPRRLDQDLPSVVPVDVEPSVELPSSLRF
ncbi:MAG TPA: hypothetical protein VKW04_03510 [Planctomycetota bacterium]|nr:hypothetical protein [Planctomycetota bacterium]